MLIEFQKFGHKDLVSYQNIHVNQIYGCLSNTLMYATNHAYMSCLPKKSH